MIAILLMEMDAHHFAKFKVARLTAHVMVGRIHFSMVYARQFVEMDSWEEVSNVMMETFLITMGVHLHVQHKPVQSVANVMDGSPHGWAHHAQHYVEMVSKLDYNNVMMETQMTMMDVHLLVHYKHAISVVFAMVGFSRGLVLIIHVRLFVVMES